VSLSIGFTWFRIRTSVVSWIVAKDCVFVLLDAFCRTELQYLMTLFTVSELSSVVCTLITSCTVTGYEMFKEVRYKMRTA
jgi:hypothetical protein